MTQAPLDSPAQLDSPVIMRKHERIREIDGLRFFAIGAVVGVHYMFTYPPLSTWVSMGWTGVDLFFVISGFLITCILLNMRRTPHPFRTFYGRRTLRILPAYYLVLFALMLISFLTEGSSFFHDQWPTLIMGSSVQKMPIWIAYHKLLFHFHIFHCSPGLLMGSPPTRYSFGMGVFWSLSVEEIFYLGWGPVVLKCSRRVITVCAIAPLLLCPFLRLAAFNCDQSYYSSFICRVDSLMAGGCLALAFAAARRGAFTEKALRRSFVLILAIALPLLTILLRRGGAFHGIDIKTVQSFAVIGYTLLALCFSSILGLCVLHRGSRWLWLLRSRPLIYVGMVSYMLYLIHMPVFYTVYLPLRHVHQLGSGLIPVTASLGAGAALLLSGLSWKYFESKVLRLKDRLFAN